jgi:hypothetical protein
VDEAARQERRTAFASLFARYVNLANDAKCMIGALGGIVQNDPHDRGMNHTDADLASWAQSAEDASHLLNERFDALLTATDDLLRASQLQAPPVAPPGYRTCGTCAHTVPDETVLKCVNSASHLAGCQVVANTLCCPLHEPR